MITLKPVKTRLFIVGIFLILWFFPKSYFESSFWIGFFDLFVLALPLWLIAWVLVGYYLFNFRQSVQITEDGITIKQQNGTKSFIPWADVNDIGVQTIVNIKKTPLTIYWNTVRHMNFLTGILVGDGKLDIIPYLSLKISNAKAISIKRDKFQIKDFILSSDDIKYYQGGAKNDLYLKLSESTSDKVLLKIAEYCHKDVNSFGKFMPLVNTNDPEEYKQVAEKYFKKSTT